MLITRPQPGAGETASLVAARGLAPVLAPLLRIDVLTAALPPPAGLQAVLAPSGNAVAALPPAYRALPLLAVGAATAARARAAGFATVRSADGDAAALTALTGTVCDPAGPPLLLAAGRGQSLPLERALLARGFRVARREVYAAEPVVQLPAAARDALRAGTLAAALFFSAETARIFVRLVRAEGLDRLVAPLDAVAIAAPAADALAPLPWRRVRVALLPKQDEVLALLQ